MSAQPKLVTCRTGPVAAVANARSLIEKIKALPPEGLDEVEDEPR